MIRLLLFLIFVSGLQAAQVTWRSRMSPQDGLAVSMRFELGSFGSFTPTAENVQEWAAQWQALDETEYDAMEGFFAGNAILEGNAPPFEVGGRAYIWGYDFRGNWILLTNPTWTWPADTIPPALPRNFFTSHPETVAVVGSVNPTGSGNHLIPALISARSPSGVYQGWEKEFGVTGISEDSDGDGFSNLEEFAFGTAPNNRTESPENFVLQRVGSQLHVSIEGTLHPQVDAWLFESSGLRTFAPLRRLSAGQMTSMEITAPRRFFQLRYFLEPFTPSP